MMEAHWLRSDKVINTFSYLFKSHEKYQPVYVFVKLSASGYVENYFSRYINFELLNCFYIPYILDRNRYNFASSGGLKFRFVRK